MLKAILASGTVLVIVGIFCPAAKADADAVLRLADEIERHEKKIRNIRVECMVRIGKEQTGRDGASTFVPGSFYEKTKVWLKGAPGDLKRVEREAVKDWAGHGPFYSEQKYAYDGKISTVIHVGSTGAILSGRYAPMDDENCWYTSECYSLHFAYANRRLSELLRAFKDRVEVVADPKDLPGAIRVTIPPERADTYSRRFWLDSARGYAIVRQEARYSLEGEPMYIVDGYQLREVAPGIWYPFAAARRAGKDYVEQYEATVVEVNTVDLDNSDALFTLRFPPRMHVKDVRTGEKSVAWLMSIRQFFDGFGSLLAIVAVLGLGVLIVSRRRRRQIQ